MVPNEKVRPVEETDEADRATSPTNPPELRTVIVDVAEDPGGRDAGEGVLAMILKSSSCRVAD